MRLRENHFISNKNAGNPDLTTLTVRINSDSQSITSHVFDTDTENEWVHAKITLHSVDNMKVSFKAKFGELAVYNIVFTPMLRTN